MGHLFFRRIAILEPDLVFSAPARPRMDKKSMAELVRWTSQARRSHADAIYARVHHETYPFAEAILDRLCQHDELPLLAPAALYHPELNPSTWHLRAQEPSDHLPLPKYDFARRGRSCHSLDEAVAAQAEGMDYVFLSPVFSTQTHPEAKPLGIEKLREVCAKLDIPVFALGGMDPEREKACRDAGAHGIAAIRMFLFEGGNA